MAGPGLPPRLMPAVEAPPAHPGRRDREVVKEGRSETGFLYRLNDSGRVPCQLSVESFRPMPGENAAAS
jgi:hypothetical protein